MGDLFKSPKVEYQTPDLPPYVQQYMQSATQFLTGQLGQPGPAYIGPFVAGLTPQEQMSLAGFTGLAYPSFATGATGISQIGATASGAYLPWNNPYIQWVASAMTDLARQQLQQQLSDVRQRYAQLGQGLSTPLVNEEIARGLQTWSQLAQGVGQLLSGAYEAERQRQMQAALASPEIGMTAMQQLMAAGQVPRLIEQQLYDAWYREFIRQLDQAWRGVSPFPSFIPLMSPQPVQYGPPPIVGLLGGIMNLLTAPLGGTILGRWMGM